MGAIPYHTFSSIILYYVQLVEFCFFYSIVNSFLVLILMLISYESI